jgi:steroid delta-isomerase-like uncharacterized protein
MRTEEYLQLLRRHMEAENANWTKEALVTLTEDCLFEDRALGQAFRGQGILPDLVGRFQYAQDERVCFTDQEAAVAEVRFQGIYTGFFPGIESTGRKVAIPLAIFVTFREGLMAGERMYWDVATLLRQLGVPERKGEPSCG